MNFAGKDGETILALIILVTFFILLVFCCLAYAVSKWCCTPPELTRIEILENTGTPEPETAERVREQQIPVQRSKKDLGGGITELN